MKDSVMNAVAAHFRPEFINRIDDVVVFHSLDKEHIRAISRIQLNGLTDRLKERDIGLNVSENAVDAISAAGFDPVYGARPLRRTVQQLLENPLAEALLEGRFGPDDTVYVDCRDDGVITFSTSKSTSNAA